MNNGELTARVAQKLLEKFAGRADILYDHGNPQDTQVGVIRSWFGDTLSRESLLADVDIAVVLPQGDHALMLIEVEESATNPKTILGDIFATLWGEHFTFQGTRHLEVDEQTILMVVSHGKTRDRLKDFILAKFEHFKSARFKIVIDTFETESDLEAKLTYSIRNLISKV